jgi:hypothetical protein
VSGPVTVASDLLPIVRNNVVANDDHISGEMLQTPDRWMAHDVLGQVHVHGVEHEARLGADGVSPQREIAREIPLPGLLPVRRLLDYRVRVALEARDEAPLEAGWRGLNGPEPVSVCFDFSVGGSLY